LCLKRIAFTDGSAIGNPGPGGWGAVVMYGQTRLQMSGPNPWTTISEMELVAAVQALRSLPGRAGIELHSDSEYRIYGMRAFVFHWPRHGWRNRRGTKLQHRELWEELTALDARLRIRWTWIKGITGIPIRTAPTHLPIRPPAFSGYRRRQQQFHALSRPSTSVTRHCRLAHVRPSGPPPTSKWLVTVSVFRSTTAT
jgi:ribonuclease HI